MRFNADQLGQSGLGIHGYTGEGEATGASHQTGVFAWQIMMPVNYIIFWYRVVCINPGSSHELLCG